MKGERIEGDGSPRFQDRLGRRRLSILRMRRRWPLRRKDGHVSQVHNFLINNLSFLANVSNGMQSWS
jgi:hypothetical protein